MCEQFRKQDAPISKVYFSPYRPTEGIGTYKVDHVLCKPHPGMILKASEELNLNLNCLY
jgi:D-glycero-D-manno-heptose 1,7-bisphosphate phosphatase